METGYRGMRLDNTRSLKEPERENGKFKRGKFPIAFLILQCSKVAAK